ncbi:hypothetical protein [Bradyrhizobium sp.]|uniref:hypothetical protein n=1 Tax=Bradyrhizobium sp. TaxID=376 RepID=UPI0027347058|nr:hypothetical protein [Bradyrhizobium sp.]MDP3076655.1 hypothetical protein [Bradyrhizobium sp.]
MADESDSALTGAAYDLANAGFRPMSDTGKKDDEQTIGTDSASLRAAAEQRGGPSDDIVAWAYVDDNGKPAPADEAITLDRAARDYASATAVDQFVVQNESSQALAARIDAMRAEAMAADSDAAEFYGFEPPRREADERKPEKPESGRAKPDPLDASDRSIDGLASEIEKAMQHPQVRQAIEEKIGEAERTRQDYRNGLAAATQIAQVSFVSQFPELASVVPDELPSALELMSRQDPARFARVEAMIATTEHMFAQQAQESRRQAVLAQQNFHDYAKSEDARLETMLKGESKEVQQAVTAEIFASARASGVEPAELTRLFNSEPLMRNAVFQQMMYDAGKYRLMLKARDAAAARPVPPVQRPGMARTVAEREHADLRSLNARLSSSGDIKDAVALYHARKSRR